MQLTKRKTISFDVTSGSFPVGSDILYSLLPPSRHHPQTTSSVFFHVCFHFFFYLFCWMCSPHQHVSLESGMLSFSPAFPVFIFLIAPTSFSPHSLASEAPLSACGLFTRNPDSTSEVWLARASRGGKYEWFLLLHSKPPLRPFILKISHLRPSFAHDPLLHPVTLFHWYVRVSVGVYLC